MRSWRKSKCERTDNFPIVAFVEKLGARPRRIASLYIGRRDGDRLVYAGKVPSGYSLAVAQEVREALDPYIQTRSPLTTPVKKPKATWVQPVIDAEVAYSSLTDHGLVREAAFKGLRDDLVPPLRRPLRIAARRVEQHRRQGPEGKHPAASARRRGAHRGGARRLLAQGRQAGAGPSRKPAAQAGAPCRRTRSSIIRVRCPRFPAPCTSLTIAKREGGEGVRVWVDDLAGLLGLVEMGAVELHPWNATVDDIEHADRLVFDLDPGPGVEWPFVIDTALEAAPLLEEEGLQDLA